MLEGSATNGAAPPLPASHPQACAAVDELVGQMRAANIAFNMPSPTNDDTPSIVLKLDLHKSKSTFAAEISAEGRKETDTIQVSETMTTHLKSDDLKQTRSHPTRKISATRDRHVDPGRPNQTHGAS